MEKLFWKDPYLAKCDAKVTSVKLRKVMLDRTVFYAFSGGQESDEGTIGGIKVVSALKQGDKEDIIDIEYELEKEPGFKVGDTVEVVINFEKRGRIMRLHSAAHIVYYFVAEKLGKLKIIGSNISSEKARIDFLHEKPLSEVLPEIEAKTNEFLANGHMVERMSDEKSPDLQWWICEKWRMPCGGTHVKSTKEIGKIRLKRRNLGAGKERVEIFLE